MHADCLQILDRLIKHDFLQAPSPAGSSADRFKLNISLMRPVVEEWPELRAEYLTVVTSPMDLGTIRYMLENGRIRSSQVRAFTHVPAV